MSLDELSSSVRQRITLTPVVSMDDVLAAALPYVGFRRRWTDDEGES